MSFKPLPLLLFNINHAFLEIFFHSLLDFLPLLLLLLKLQVEAVLVILEHLIDQASMLLSALPLALSVLNLTLEVLLQLFDTAHFTLDRTRAVNVTHLVHTNCLFDMAVCQFLGLGLVFLFVWAGD